MSCSPAGRIKPFISLNFFPEGEDRADRQAEMLEPEGDSHDGDTEKKAAHQVDDGNLPPSQQDPDEVHNNGQASRFLRTVYQFMAERPEGIGAQFEELHTEGDPDDGDAHQKPHEIIDEGDEDSAEDEPEDVSDKIHKHCFCKLYGLASYAKTFRWANSLTACRGEKEWLFL